MRVSLNKKNLVFSVAAILLCILHARLLPQTKQYSDTLFHWAPAPSQAIAAANGNFYWGDGTILRIGHYNSTQKKIEQSFYKCLQSPITAIAANENGDAVIGTAIGKLYQFKLESTKSLSTQIEPGVIFFISHRLDNEYFVVSLKDNKYVLYTLSIATNTNLKKIKEFTEVDSESFQLESIYVINRYEEENRQGTPIEYIYFCFNPISKSNSNSKILMLKIHGEQTSLSEFSPPKVGKLFSIAAMSNKLFVLMGNKIFYAAMTNGDPTFIGNWTELRGVDLFDAKDFVIFENANGSPIFIITDNNELKYYQLSKDYDAKDKNSSFSIGDIAIGKLAIDDRIESKNIYNLLLATAAHSPVLYLPLYTGVGCKVSKYVGSLLETVPNKLALNSSPTCLMTCPA